MYTYSVDENKVNFGLIPYTASAVVHPRKLSGLKTCTNNCYCTCKRALASGYFAVNVMVSCQRMMIVVGSAVDKDDMVPVAGREFDVLLHPLGSCKQLFLVKLFANQLQADWQIIRRQRHGDVDGWQPCNDKYTRMFT